MSSDKEKEFIPDDPRFDPKARAKQAKRQAAADVLRKPGGLELLESRIQRLEKWANENGMKEVAAE